jgi:hypothetical protein
LRLFASLLLGVVQKLLSQENKTVYFDLHATGAGYINRAREVSPENGDAFYSFGNTTTKNFYLTKYLNKSNERC